MKAAITEGGPAATLAQGAPGFGLGSSGGPAAPAIHVVHGERDEAFPVRDARRSVARFRRLGYTVSYTEVPDMTHSYPSTALTRNLLAWLLCFPKRSLPGRPQP